MVNFDAKRTFSLAIIARSGFMHLTTPEQQRETLLTIKKHLAPDGVLSLNTFQPHPEYQAQQMRTGPEDYSLRTEYINSEGKRERIYNAIGYDHATQIMSGNWKFETLDEKGNVIDTRIRPLVMRQTYTQEMRYLCELCGYEIVECDYQAAAGNSLIWILKKREE